MAANISAIRANVRKDLHDEDSSNYRWTDAVLDRHIGRAVVEYSLADPLEQKTTLTATPGSRDIEHRLADERGRRRERRVAGRRVPAAPTSASRCWQTTLTLDTVNAPSAADNVNVYWTKLHTLDGSSSTIPPRIRGADRGGRRRLRRARLDIVRHQPHQHRRRRRLGPLQGVRRRAAPPVPRRPRAPRPQQHRPRPPPLHHRRAQHLRAEPREVLRAGQRSARQSFSCDCSSGMTSLEPADRLKDRNELRAPMRTLSSDLLAAQRSASSEPHVDVVVENSIGGMRRLDFAQIDATSNTIAQARRLRCRRRQRDARPQRQRPAAVLQQRDTIPGGGAVERSGVDNAGDRHGHADRLRREVARASPSSTSTRRAPASRSSRVDRQRRHVRRGGRRRHGCGGRHRSGGRVQEQQRRPRDRLGDGHDAQHHQAHRRRVRRRVGQRRRRSAASTASRWRTGSTRTSS